MPKLKRTIKNPPKPRPQSMISACDFKPKLTHKDLQQMIATYAKLKGWKTQFWWRSFHSSKGFLDLVICRPPRLIFAEIKIPPDKVTTDQQKWIDIWKQMSNVECYVWLPEDWYNDTIIKILE